MPLKKWERFKLAFGDVGVNLDGMITRWKQRAQASIDELARLLPVVQALTGCPGTLTALTVDAFQQRFNLARDSVDVHGASEKTRESGARQLEAVHSEVQGHLRTIAPLLRADLTATLAAPGGELALDTLVEQSEDEDFVKGALKARFGLDTLEVPDKTPRTSLQKLYKAATLVPRSHTTDNTNLKVLNFRRPGRDEAFIHSADFDKWSQTINLSISQANEQATRWERNFDDSVPVDQQPTGEIEILCALMTHEVGHSVEASRRVMDTRMGNASFGNWQHHVDDEFIAMLAKKYKLSDAGLVDAAGVSLNRALLHELLKDVLKLGKTDRDPASNSAAKALAEALPTLDAVLSDSVVLEAIAKIAGWNDPNTPERWPVLNTQRDKVKSDFVNRFAARFKGTNDMASKMFGAMFVKKVPPEQAIRQAHGAATMALHELQPLQRQAFMDTEAAKVALWVHKHAIANSAGLWWTRQQAVDRLTHEGRVWTISNGEQYFSYDPAARRKGVSAYQFNAPAEWFAELYAVYYNGKLPEGHPDIRPVLSLVDDRIPAPP
ncbi:MAG: hypothetical protein H6741_24495 [Alphaproteobacteria bacterium]|nr:hypothetical protein [Alphaproteobacteria bacterium]